MNNIVSQFKIYRDGCDEIGELRMLVVEILSNMPDDIGLRTVRILDGRLIIESHLEQLDNIENSIQAISNYIDSNSSIPELQVLANQLKDCIAEYHECDYIKRLEKWIKLIKTSDSFSECWNEYEEVNILAESYIDKMNKKMKIIEDTLSHTHQ